MAEIPTGKWELPVIWKKVWKVTFVVEFYGIIP